MKKAKHSIVWHYLKHDKLKLALYILVLLHIYQYCFQLNFLGKSFRTFILKDTAGFMKF